MFLRGIDTINVITQDFVNSSPAGGSNITYPWSGTDGRTLQYTTTQSYSHTFGIEIGVEVGGKVGIPLFAEGEAKVSTKTSYQYQAITTTGTVTGKTSTLTYGASVNLAPGHGMRCRSTAQQGHYASDYTSVVRLTLNGGQTFTIEQPGHLDSVGYSKALTICSDADPKDLAPDALDLLGLPTHNTKRALTFKA